MAGFSLKVFVSGLLVYFLLKVVEFGPILSIIQSANASLYLLAIIIIFLVPFTIGTFKWQEILKEFGVNQKLVYLFKLNLIASFFSITLLGQISGELAKTYKVTKGKKNKPKYIISILIDRLTGFVVIGLISFSYFFLELKFSLLLILFSAIFLFLLFLDGRLPKIIRIFGLKIKYLKGVENLKPNFWLKIFILSILFHLTTAFALWLMAQAINVDISYFVLTWVYAVISILVFLPITIGGIGLREAGFSFIFPLIGFTVQQGIALSLLLFFAQLIFAFVGALIYAFDF